MSRTSAVLTGSWERGRWMVLWSKGQTALCRLARHVLQTECPHPRLVGSLVLRSNPFSQTGQLRYSVHWGACTGIFLN
jgi:hypothetical protein